MTVSGFLIIVQVLLIGLSLCGLYIMGKYVIRAKKGCNEAEKMYEDAIKKYEDACGKHEESQKKFQSAEIYVSYIKLLGENYAKIFSWLSEDGAEFFSTEEGLLCVRSSLKTLRELRDMYPEGNWELLIAQWSKYLP